MLRGGEGSRSHEKSVAVLVLNPSPPHPELHDLPAKAMQLGLLTTNAEILFLQYHTALVLIYPHWTAPPPELLFYWF